MQRGLHLDSLDQSRTVRIDCFALGVHTIFNQEFPLRSETDFKLIQILGNFSRVEVQHPELVRNGQIKGQYNSSGQGQQQETAKHAELWTFGAQTKI